MQERQKYDLEERTALFAERVIDYARTLERNEINRILMNQLIRSTTSIGANYMEAIQASSKKDFKNKIYICKKESNETKYWFRMIMYVNPNKKEIWGVLRKEAHELTLIFAKICRTCSVPIKN